MTQSMIEKVAEAIEEVVLRQEFTSYEEAARAAIEAMREPTNDMLQAMYEAMFEDKFTGGELPMLNAGFEAAIDAALNEEVSE